MKNRISPGKALRSLIESEQNIMMIGAFNGLVGRILKEKGKHP